MCVFGLWGTQAACCTLRLPSHNYFADARRWPLAPTHADLAPWPIHVGRELFARTLTLHEILDQLLVFLKDLLVNAVQAMTPVLHEQSFC